MNPDRRGVTVASLPAVTLALSGCVEELPECIISVKKDVLREEAAVVLRHYARSGGKIYNARGGDQRGGRR